jgi:hypothetical protein
LDDVDLDKITSVSLGPGTRQKACRAMDQASRAYTFFRGYVSILARHYFDCALPQRISSHRAGFGRMGDNGSIRSDTTVATSLGICLDPEPSQAPHNPIQGVLNGLARFLPHYRPHTDQ